MLDEVEERRVIFAEPVDLNESEAEDLNEEAGSEEPLQDDEDDIIDDIPIRKVRKFDQEEMLAAKQELLLTRNFKLEKEYGAAYTGGTIRLLKDGRYALALKDEKINLIHVDSAVVLGTLEEENEAVITFALSAN